MRRQGRSGHQRGAEHTWDGLEASGDGFGKYSGGQKRPCKRQRSDEEAMITLAVWENQRKEEGAGAGQDHRKGSFY